MGLPLARDIPVDATFAWTDARRVCVRRLLRLGGFAKWPTAIERLDRLMDRFPEGPARDQFMRVAQAVLALRVRGDGEGHRLVRAEMNAHGVPPGLRDEALDTYIADDVKPLLACELVVR